MRNNPTVAIVDDDESVRDTTKDLLDSAGLSAATFDSAESFLQSKGTCAIRCLVADMRMPGMTGLCVRLFEARDLGANFLARDTHDRPGAAGPSPANHCSTQGAARPSALAVCVPCQSDKKYDYPGRTAFSTR